MDKTTLRKIAKVFDLHEDKATKKAVWAIFGVLFLLAIYIRQSLVDFQTMDYLSFASWYDFVKAHGLHSFRYEFSNYNPPYTYFLYILAHIPVPRIDALKWLLGVFDIFLAVSVYYVTKLIKPKGYMPIVAALGTLFLPTVVLNGVMWGQFDQLYVGATLFSLYYGMRGKGRWAWAWIGIALAIKLQAVFFLPVLGILCFSRIRWQDVYWAIASFLVVTLPPMVAGRSLGSLLNIYPAQASYFSGYLTIYAPNVYQWVPNWAFPFFNQMAVGLTVAAVLAIILYTIINKRFTDRDILLATALMLYIVPFLLPAMHERYFFPAGIASMLLAFAYPTIKYVALAVLMQLITLCTFFHYLFNTTPIPFTILAMLVLFIICVLAVDYFHLPFELPRTIKNSGV
ncbi:MAG TPA: glycosyltransferase 87 family protein [Patescibacteria group bacterium]|nr:glycosyltransferase 87 family protein [Patescibacteria group bacterium]